MKIVFVCIGNFQEYILDNIKNLQLFGNTDITVLTNQVFFPLLKNIDNIDLVPVEELDDYGFIHNNRLDLDFRNGFWTYCSMRFFYLYSYLVKYNIKNCIHLENDVMGYINFDELLPYFNKNKLYATFDSYDRVIPGILYIPNHTTLRPIIENYNFTMNDMYNLARFDETVIEPLPIIPTFGCEYAKLWKNFLNCIYDAAAMGQYLGGIDKRNKEGDTRGFVNETCLVKYDNYKFYWKKENQLFVPYLYINGEYIRIVNLHIHSKDLYRFMANGPMETKYIPFHES